MTGMTVPNALPHDGEDTTMPKDALRTLLPVAGWSTDRADAVAFTGGDDPVLPTPFRIGMAGAATIAATGVAVADLWEMRTGRQQSVPSICARPRRRCAAATT